jgi:hypothetical protein
MPGTHTLDNQVKLALHRRFPWVGDQLLASQCQQIQWFLQECQNGYAHWDQCIFIFAGLHMHMALESSILECHRGKTVGATLGSDIVLLSHVRLQKPKNRKLDYHAVDEFPLHEVEADFQGLFMQLTGCHTSEELTVWMNMHTANDIYSLASEMLRFHASSGALNIDNSKDGLHRSSIMRQHDLLLYASSRHAYKFGDVDRIYDLMHDHLIFFMGTGNKNYSKETFEFLQLLKHEVTPDLW